VIDRLFNVILIPFPAVKTWVVVKISDVKMQENEWAQNKKAIGI
jgi:hypothetical protein